jgi:uncharacterized protein (DUF488 family)
MTTPHLYSIGHSNLSLDFFLQRLLAHPVAVLADVRSLPVSRFNPHFNEKSLQASLQDRGVRYEFMGRELGGRPQDPHFYDQEGHALYGEMAQSAAFLDGLERLKRESLQDHVAVLCSEENPAVCHRHLLIARRLLEEGWKVTHLRADGSVDDAAELELNLRWRRGKLMDPEIPWRSPKPLLKKSPKR